MKLAVVTSFYSFAGFKRPVANLHRFLRQMERDGVAVFGTEAHAQSTAQQTKPYPNWKQVVVNPTTQTLWHKEALLNLTESRVPEEYDAVAWIDADVWFSNPNWVQDAESALQQHDVVQLFEEAVWTSETGVEELRRPSIGRVPLDRFWKSHPGFAWAMRRSLWKRAGGLYPFALSGGGDSVMTIAFQGQKLWPFLYKHLGKNTQPYDSWVERLGRPKLGHIPGECWHEWHGNRQDRNYVGRSELVKNVEIGKDITLGLNGLPMWTKDADKTLIQRISQHFVTRNEDGKLNTRASRVHGASPFRQDHSRQVSPQ